MNRLMNKPTRPVRPAKTQISLGKTHISLGIRPVWSEFSLFAWRKFGSLATDWEHSEDSDQTWWMPRLIWVFAGHTVILLVLSRGGWNEPSHKKRYLSVMRWAIFQISMRCHRSTTRCLKLLLVLYISFHLNVYRFMLLLSKPLANADTHVWMVKALARLRECAGSPEPSLFAYVINTIFTWADSNETFLVISNNIKLAGPSSSVDWYSRGRGFDPPVRQHSFVEVGHGIISTAILSLPLIQVGQFSVTGEKICTECWLTAEV